MRNTLEFTYQLNYDEIYEAFFLLSMKWNRKIRKILTIILTLIAICFLTFFAFNRNRIYSFFLAVVDIFLLSYLIYMPALKARRGAKKVCSRKGTYRIKLTKQGQLISNNERIAIAGDANARVIETPASYVIRPDSQHTFCIPKRIMSLQEQKETEAILRSACRYRTEL
ncbi:MAG: hypothetical protein Q4B37_06505 [Eubacteriales bacterium]|nr:hypothetical protein [Eubacteriales bacterium]